MYYVNAMKCDSGKTTEKSNDVSGLPSASPTMHQQRNAEITSKNYRSYSLSNLKHQPNSQQYRSYSTHRERVFAMRMRSRSVQRKSVVPSSLLGVGVCRDIHFVISCLFVISPWQPTISGWMSLTFNKIKLFVKCYGSDDPYAWWCNVERQGQIFGYVRLVFR